MVTALLKRRTSPIGVDLGARSVKLAQFSSDGAKLVDAVRWDVAGLEDDALPPSERDKRIVAALQQARDGRRFRGRDAIMCLGAADLLVQSVRIPKSQAGDLPRMVLQEAAGRVPYSLTDAEVRFLEAADVRQGDAVMREVILLACHRPVLERKLKLLSDAGLRPVAVDFEPLAMVRAFVRQFRRDDDSGRRVMFIHVGGSSCFAAIAQGSDLLFIKCFEIAGRTLDKAVAQHLGMTLAESAALRRHNGDRRADQQDPEIIKSVAEAVRPVHEKLAQELSLCVRYHGVTFRGQPLTQAVLGGSEASPALAELLTQRLNLRCEVGDPLRTCECTVPVAHKTQWAVATGLALRNEK